MKLLLDDAGHAKQLGAAGRQVALNKFDISRFVYQWEQLFKKVASKQTIESFTE
jgi:hypothetical protein